MVSCYEPRMKDEKFRFISIYCIQFQFVCIVIQLVISVRELLIREIAVVSSRPSLQLKVVFQFEYYQHIDETSYHAIVLGHHPVRPCIRDIAMDPTRTPGVHQI